LKSNRNLGVSWNNDRFRSIWNAICAVNAGQCADTYAQYPAITRTATTHAASSRRLGARRDLERSQADHARAATKKYAAFGCTTPAANRIDSAYHDFPRASSTKLQTTVARSMASMRATLPMTTKKLPRKKTEAIAVVAGAIDRRVSRSSATVPR
jgi:hypothetical protein